MMRNLIVFRAQNCHINESSFHLREEKERSDTWYVKDGVASASASANLKLSFTSKDGSHG